MTDKNTEAFVREQAQAVLKVQEEAINSQMKMMESLYGDNPEMLAMMKAQLEQAMANQSALIWLYRGFDGKARLTMPRFFMSWSLGWVMGSEGLSRRA